MEVDVMEMLNKHMDLKTAGVDEKLDGIRNSGMNEEFLVDKIRQPEATTDESDDALEFGDMPNGKIRYEKQREKLKKLEEEIASLKTQSSKEDDDTTNLSDEEREILKQSEEVENLKQEINQMKDKDVLQTLKQREENFWSNYTKEERAKFAPMMELEIRRSDLIEHVLAGKMTLEKVMAMVNPNAVNRTAPVQKATSVFGKGGTSTSSRAESVTDSGFVLGQKVLNNPAATNAQRRVAINVMTQDLAKDFLR